MNHSCR